MADAAKVITHPDCPDRAAECRTAIVGPHVNQPDRFPGYDGFVGWQVPLLLHDGELIVTFSAGYWHASPSTSQPATAKYLSDNGVPLIDAPRGGRAMITRSGDGGVTWSRPETVVDTPEDDRHPSPARLPDGTVICSFFAYGFGDSPADRPHAECHTMLIRSLDGGHTWEKEIIRPRTTFAIDATDSPIISLRDGSALLVIYGEPKSGERSQIGVLRSTDSGENWDLLSIVKADYDLSEPGMAELHDGRLALITRPRGEICWSKDGGRSWTTPVSTGIPMIDPQLITLHDGTLLCLHGSRPLDVDSPVPAGGVRAIISGDGGETWHSASNEQGFVVDAGGYGYCKGTEMPDGSVFVAYQGTAGGTMEDARSMSIYGMRIRVRSNYSGIDLLPCDSEGEPDHGRDC